MQIVALVLAIFAVNVAIWIPVVRWLGRRNAALIEQLRAELDGGEGLILGPHAAVYRGGSGEWSKVKGNAVVALSPRRLILVKVTGGRVELPLAELTGVREDPWFEGSAVAGRSHVIVSGKDGRELGFFVEHHDEWVAALREQVVERAVV